jgi:hypothetical protein
MELLSGHEKIIIKSGISLNAGTLNQGFTVSGSIRVGRVDGEAGKNCLVLTQMPINKSIFTIFLVSSFQLRSFASSHHPLSSKYCRNLKIGESKLSHSFTSSSDLYALLSSDVL